MPRSRSSPSPTRRPPSALADAIAPEHLELIGPESEAASGSVRNAGAVFIGPAAATAFGDYVAGSNHVLPTGGAARFQSALSREHLPAPDGARILAARRGRPPGARWRGARPRGGIPRPRRVDGAPRVTRSSDISRKTNETDIVLSLALDGAGEGVRTTGVGFFDHMLDAVARHGGSTST